jgi:hypothetical protein
VGLLLFVKESLCRIYLIYQELVYVPKPDLTV